MNCGDIDELSPLRRSGELDETARREFDAHIAGCDDCATELRRQSDEDARLRDSMAAALAHESSAARILERRVMRRVAQDRLRRWLVPSAAVAALALLAVGLMWNAHRRTSAPPAIFADAARDHTVEIVQNAPRHWRTEPSDIATIETTQGISDHDVKAIEVTGYRLQRAKICRLGGKPYMHLVYAKAGRQISVYMKVRGDRNIAESTSSAGSLQLASFTHGRVQAVIVTDAPGSECAQFAREAEAAL